MPPSNLQQTNQYSASTDDQESSDASSHTYVKQLQPAEHLEQNDDLCSSILVDQIACDRLHDNKLGVHHCQPKFAPPAISPAEVLKIIRRVIKGGDVREAQQQLVNTIPAMRDHLAGKPDKKRRDDFLAHINLYLEIYHPKSRVEVWRTDRYKEVSQHDELGVYATCTIPPGVTIHEMSGRCAELTDQYFGSDDESDDGEGSRPSRIRRSLRNGRRDFSIVNSTRDGKSRLFLGPARFINHDCNPNVELSATAGNMITFRSIRRINVGDELFTTYGDHYFDKNNSMCMCGTCEQAGRGYYSKNRPGANGIAGASRASSMAPLSRRVSALRVENLHEDALGSDEDDEGSWFGTPTENGFGPQTPSHVAASVSPTDGDDGSVDDESTTTKTRRPYRQVRNNTARLDFSKRCRASSAMDLSQRPPVEDPDSERCITCVDPLENRYWSSEGWDNFCPRCSRHALIFRLPWPAKMPDQVVNFPPRNLIPMNYRAKAINSVPLPSVERRKRVTEVTITAEGDDTTVVITSDAKLLPPTKMDRAFWKTRDAFEAEDAHVQRLREAEWGIQEAKEQREKEQLARREEAKQQREEEKQRKMKNKIRGSGLWTTYEIIDVEEAERRIKERNTVVSGTRSGRKFTRPSTDEDESEVIRKAQIQLNRDREQELKNKEASRKWRQKHNEKRLREAARQNGGESAPNSEAMTPSSVDAPLEFPDAGSPSFLAPSSYRESSPEVLQAGPSQLAPPMVGTDVIDLTGLSDSDDHKRPQNLEALEVIYLPCTAIVLSDSDESDRALQRMAPRSRPIPQPRHLATSAPAAPVAGSSPPVKRGPGRPRGSGPKQMREKRRLERERAAASQKAALLSHFADIDNSVTSLDEASPPSAHDDTDSQDGFSSSDLGATWLTAKPSSNMVSAAPCASAGSQNGRGMSPDQDSEDGFSSSDLGGPFSWPNAQASPSKAAGEPGSSSAPLKKRKRPINDNDSAAPGALPSGPNTKQPRKARTFFNRGTFVVPALSSPDDPSPPAVFTGPT